MPRQTQVTGDVSVGRVGSVTETDQDTITNGVLRVTNGKGNCRAKGLLKSGEVGTHSDHECFGFFTEHGRRRRQKVHIGDRGRVETIRKVERGKRRSTNAAVIDSELGHRQHGRPIGIGGAQNAELLRDQGVNTLHGAVSTRMEGDGRRRFDAECGAHVDPVVRNDAAVTVGANDARQTMKTEHVLQE
jgi:hypothetical protein